MSSWQGCHPACTADIPVSARAVDLRRQENSLKKMCTSTRVHYRGISVYGFSTFTRDLRFCGDHRRAPNLWGVSNGVMVFNQSPAIIALIFASIPRVLISTFLMSVLVMQEFREAAFSY